MKIDTDTMNVECEPCADCGRMRVYNWDTDEWSHEAPACWLASIQGDDVFVRNEDAEVAAS
jgi:hypothetical protein